jgi:hypothetical protein
VDEDWLLLEVEKSGIQKLIRIESIKGIQFNNSACLNKACPIRV